MKKLFFILSALVLFSFSYAQKIKVRSDRESIGGGKNDVLIVTIYEANEDAVEKAWRSVMKGYGAKVSSGSEIVAKGATIKDMIDKPIDVYAKIKKGSDGITFTVAFDLGGAFLSQSVHPDKYRVAEKIVHDFAVDVTKEAFESLLKEQNKKLDGIQRKYDKLIKENERLHSDIEKYKKEIEEAENDIKENLTNQDGAKKELEDQKNVIDEIGGRQKKIEY
ncbi:MAG: hypothetical protein PHD97_06290 [Bacteroidales bacterium]|nr:hypothetical protein [Bacteroidales bacterium]